MVENPEIAKRRDTVLRRMLATPKESKVIKEGGKSQEDPQTGETRAADGRMTKRHASNRTEKF